MKAYLRVKVGKGMFDNENSIVIDSYYEGKIIPTSGFFWKEHIKNGKLVICPLNNFKYT